MSRLTLMVIFVIGMLLGGTVLMAMGAFQNSQIALTFGDVSIAGGTILFAVYLALLAIMAFRTVQAAIQQARWDA